MKNRYEQFIQFLTIVLFVNLGAFALYLLFAALGLLVLKIIAATVAIVPACFCLWMLIGSKEALQNRSLWLTCSFGSILLLTLVSLICGYPAP